MEGGNIADTERLQEYAVKYALNTKEGVQRLLNDYHRLQARKTDRSDYPAADILLDLQKAVELAGLTDRQRQALRLHFIELKTQEEVAELMGGITQVGVHYHIQGALKRIARVYAGWDYGGACIIDSKREAR